MKDFLKLIFFGVVKTPKLEMFNPVNGERKSVSSNSFDLTVLLVGGFFGLPLFFKRLWGWAWLMFALTTVQLLSFYEKLKQVLNAATPEDYYAFTESSLADDAAGAALLVLSVLLSFKANKWAVERLLKKGWRFERPEDKAVVAAVKKWHISKHCLKRSETVERL